MRINSTSIYVKLNNHAANHNLQMLCQRRKKQRFVVDQYGELQVMRSFKDKIYYLFHRKKAKAKVRAAITQTVKKIEVSSFRGHDKTAEIQDIFFNRLAGLREDLYDRGAISDEVEAILSPELAKIKQSDVNRHSWTVIQAKDAEYAKKTEEARLAVKLGVDFKPTGRGTSGSYFARNRYGKSLFVFKPADEGNFSPQSPYLLVRMRYYIRKAFPFLGGHRCINSEKVHHAEAAATVVDRHLGTDIVPTTKIDRFDSRMFIQPDRKNKRPILSKEGSCQLFAEGYIPADKAFKIKPITPSWVKKKKLGSMKLQDKISQKSYERLVILDFVIGNLDRHCENWMLNDRGQIAAIDNGLSFGFEHSTDAFSLHNQYRWRLLPHAKSPFSEESKKYLQNPKANKAAMIEELKQVFPGFENGHLQAMEDRIAVLIKFIEEGKTPEELSYVRTPYDFKKILRVP